MNTEPTAADTPRQLRRRQLMHMWRDRRGQSAVLSLFYSLLPPGEKVRAGLSVFDVILDHEFGKDGCDQSPTGTGACTDNEAATPDATISSDHSARASADDRNRECLRKGLSTLRGHSSYALLTDICDAARGFGFDGALSDALRLLATIPGIKVEACGRVSDSRVLTACDEPQEHANPSESDPAS